MKWILKFSRLIPIQFLFFIVKCIQFFLILNWTGCLTTNRLPDLANMKGTFSFLKQKLKFSGLN